MRINLNGKTSSFKSKFLKCMVAAFAEYYDFSNNTLAWDYATNGAQGLQTFIDYLNKNGYDAEIYYLPPNTDFLQYFDDGVVKKLSSESPSYGFVIPDNNPMLVEFKLKN
jgi:hypothetical protein